LPLPQSLFSPAILTASSFVGDPLLAQVFIPAPARLAEDCRLERLAAAPVEYAALFATDSRTKDGKQNASV
jgi:hypothetical protein